MQDTLDTTPMDKAAVAKYLNLGIPQLAKLVAQGLIPEGRTLGGKKKYWFKVHLDQYRARVMNSISETWEPNKGVTPVKIVKAPKAPKAPKEPEIIIGDAPAKRHVGRPTKAEAMGRMVAHLAVVKQREARGEEDLEDIRRRQKMHIQESYQDTEVLDDGCAEHLKSILTDLSALLKQRKGQV